jgi:hypothetical protein
VRFIFHLLDQQSALQSLGSPTVAGLGLVIHESGQCDDKMDEGRGGGGGMSLGLGDTATFCGEDKMIVLGVPVCLGRHKNDQADENKRTNGFGITCT